MSRKKKIAVALLAAVLVMVSLSTVAYAADDSDGGLASLLLSGLKNLFIPSRDYFISFREDITSRFDRKFGAVKSAFGYLNTRFKNLRAYTDLGGVFKVVFPKNSILNGLSVNFLSVAGPVLAFVRECLTGLCCVLTAIMCYRKVITMVNT